MTLLEKIKVNLDYLCGKAEPKLYAKPNKSSMLKIEVWQKRWEIFSDHGCGFVWYGVDSQENLARFICDEAYIPEAFFQDVVVNNKIDEYFKSLPKYTSSHIPINLRPSMQELAQRDEDNSLLWGPLKTAQSGVFAFMEADDINWHHNEQFYHYKRTRNPYELLAIPDECLKISDLSGEIQELLKPFYFENLKFEDCNFLDVSKHFQCEN